MAKKKLGPSRKVFQKYSKYARKPGRPKKTLTSLVKKLVLGQAETKYVMASGENQQLYHNGGTGPTYCVITNLTSSSQGSGQNLRVGDAVRGKGIAVRLWLSNKLDRPNVMYRIFVVAGEYTQTTNPTPAGLFQGSCANKILDFFNTDRYRVVYHKIINPMSGDYSLETGATNKEHSRFLKFYIPLRNKYIKYQTDGGSAPTSEKCVYSIGIIAYDAYGSVTTDNIASFAYTVKFYFKDL